MRVYGSLLFLVSSVLHCSVAFGATTAQATVTYSVSSITEISVSGNPATLTVSSATAGQQPTSVTDTSTTYNVTTNATAQRIFASLSSGMPTGLTLSINLVAPPGGTSLGEVSMTTANQNLVTGISNVAAANLMITYTLSALATAAPVGATNTVVTYTIGP